MFKVGSGASEMAQGVKGLAAKPMTEFKPWRHTTPPTYPLSSTYAAWYIPLK